MTLSIGALAGGLAACGGLLVISGVLARRPMSLAHRVGPYLAGPSTAASARDDAGVRRDTSTLGRIYGPIALLVARRIQTWLGHEDEIRRRLVAAGRHEASALDHRLSQVVWATASTGIAALALMLLATTSGAVSPVAGLVLLVVGGLMGALSCDRALTREVTRRRAQVRAGLPAVADLLALAVGSGESPAAALDRVGRVARGPLADECRRACADTASGVSFLDALDGMAERVDIPSVRRFVDGLSIAVGRGTPLADVLRAQAGDARADLHRSLLEIAGRKELLMLLPVVCLVLPTVVLVALFPAISALTSVAP